ncbi:MAG: hypothetical protein RLZZ378_916, partial [Actinomycetota bacterium]
MSISSFASSNSSSNSSETTSDKTFEKFDPKTSLVLANYKDYSDKEVLQIVSNSKLASKSWQRLGFKGRKKIL